MPDSIVKMLGIIVLLSCFSGSSVAQENTKCIVGALPYDAIPKEFVRPYIPLSCWRSEREVDRRVIWFDALFDVTPEGKTKNIRVEAIDPACANGPIEQMMSELRYDCSEDGYQNNRVRRTISSPVN